MLRALKSRAFLYASLLSLAIIYAMSPTLGMTFSMLDSSSHLNQIIAFSPWDYFTNPDALQVLSPSNLTYGLGASQEIDYALGGLNPKAYFIHQIISVVVFSLVFMGFLADYTKSWTVAFLGSLICFLSVASNEVNVYVPARHYVEGAIFAIISIWSFRSFVLGRGRKWFWVSVIAYGLSTMFKEVFVPLPGILFFMGHYKIEDWRMELPKRINWMLPFAAVLFIYMVWRHHLLGGFGGYHLPVNGADYVLSERLNAFVLSAFKTIYQPVIIMLIIGLSFVLSVRRKGTPVTSSLKFSAALFCVLFPLYFLKDLMLGYLSMPRWFYTVVILLIVAVCVSIVRLPKRLSQVSMLALILAFAPTFKSFVMDQKYTEADILQKGTKFFANAQQLEPNTIVVLNDLPNNLTNELYSGWPFVLKLHRGEWGPVFLSPVQLSYHSGYKEKALVDKQFKTLETDPLENIQYELSDALLSSIDFRKDKNVFSVQAANLENAETCLVYFYNQNNGYFHRFLECAEKDIRAKELKISLFRAGLDPETLNVAYVVQHKDKSFTISPAYELSDMTTLEPLEMSIGRKHITAALHTGEHQQAG